MVAVVVGVGAGVADVPGFTVTLGSPANDSVTGTFPSIAMGAPPQAASEQVSNAVAESSIFLGCIR